MNSIHSTVSKAMNKQDEEQSNKPKSVEDAMRAASELREKYVIFTDPPEEECDDRQRKQFCLSCGETHYKEICPECGSDAQDDL